MNFFSARIIPVFLLVFALGISGYPDSAKAQPGESITLQVFYDELAPYGHWIYDRKYDYVWVPDVKDFHPYHTNGYWEMTVYGNTWVSLYPWGWAPFHYGRWMFDSFYGWVWVPGYEWAPAWVCWRYGQGFYWWAPLHPGFTITINFSFYDCPYYWWTYTPHHYLYGPRHSEHYAVNSRRDNMGNTNIVNHTKVDGRSNAIYTTGPSIDEVRTVSGTDVTIRNIEEVGATSETRMPGDRIPVYRPQLSPEDLENMRARPSKFENSTKKLNEKENIWEWNDRDNQNENRKTITPNIEQASRQTRPQKIGQRRPRTPEVPIRNQPGTPVRTDQPVQRTKPVPQPQPAQPRRQHEQQRVPVERTPEAPVRR